MRGLALGLGWLGTYYVLVRYGALALPSSIARQTTLAQYLAMVQVVSIAVGVASVFFLTKSDRVTRGILFPELAEESAKRPPSLIVAFRAALLGPLIYLLASKLGIHLAWDTLLEELAARGRQAVQQQTGELGRSAQADTLWTILPFTVLLAPLGEELLFRGGIYGGVQALFGRSSAPPSQEEESPPESIAIAGLPPSTGPSLGQRVAIWATSGGLAVLLSSLIFGAMHADVDGGMGIVRVVTASVIGLACGIARHLSRGLVAPLVLHMAFNFLAIATARRWLVSDEWPTEKTIPTLLTPLSAVCAALALALWVWWTRLRNSR